MPTPPARRNSRTPRCSPDEIRLAIERFLAASQQPTLFEPGEVPLAIRPGQFDIEPVRDTMLRLTVWDGARTLSRKIFDCEEFHRARLVLHVEHFGGKPGTVILADLRAAANASLPQRGKRTIKRELVRASLARQFPGWRIAELTTEPDLAHSLSPTYPRAWLRKGTQGVAAIAAPDAASANGALTFGLIWLDYLRRRDPRTITHTLAVFVPSGAHTDTALRLRYLDPSKLTTQLFQCSPDGYEERVDPALPFNLDTRVLPPEPLDLHAIHPVEQAIREMPDVEAVELERSRRQLSRTRVGSGAPRTGARRANYIRNRNQADRLRITCFGDSRTGTFCEPAAESGCESPGEHFVPQESGMLARIAGESSSGHTGLEPLSRTNLRAGACDGRSAPASFF